MKGEENFSYRFFQNRACAYFPCHKNVPEDEFNCLFCYCPLYLTECGGDGRILENGIKDCTGCTIPHRSGGYDRITGGIKQRNNALKNKGDN